MSDSISKNTAHEGGAKATEKQRVDQLLHNAQLCNQCGVKPEGIQFNLAEMTNADKSCWSVYCPKCQRAINMRDWESPEKAVAAWDTMNER